MKKKSKPKKKKVFSLSPALTIGIFSLAIIFLFSWGFFFYYKDRVYPHISALGEKIGSQNKKQVEKIISEKKSELETKTISLVKEGKKVETTLSEMGITIDQERMVNTAFEIGRGKEIGRNFLTIAKNNILGFKVPTYFKIDEESIKAFIFQNLEAKEELPVSSKITYRNGIFSALPSREGKGIGSLLLATQVVNHLNNPKESQVNVPEEIIKKPEITEQEALKAVSKANEILETVPTLIADKKRWSTDKDIVANFLTFKKVPGSQLEETDPNYTPDDIFTFVSPLPADTFSAEETGNYELEVGFSREEIRNYLRTIAPGIDQTEINATLGFSNGELIIVSEGQDAITLNIEESIEKLENGIKNKQNPIELSVTKKKAKISKENIGELGIKTLIGQGVSNFSGSPKNRRHNISVGAARFNGIIIAPEEEFSFLKTLGPVDASTGYLPELVIKNDKTIPEYGGGMCQVSTTAFRGAVESGLQITERQNHAYPVSYYSPQGTDATVYIPSPDLKFVNNTPAYILIQTKIQGNILTFEFYGTSDGRRVEKIGPSVFDKKSDGSMKATWTQKVYKADGSLMFEKTFLSKYDSPSKYPHPGEEEPKPPKKKKKH